MKLWVLFSLILTTFAVQTFAEIGYIETGDSKDIQERGEAILKAMADVNRYWLSGPGADVEDYSYDFLLVDQEPRTIEVDRPRKAGRTSRQGISYYSALHKLASNFSDAMITLIEEDEAVIRLDYTFKNPIKIACGNGISGAWRGYFSRRIERGSLWLDMEKKVPVKMISGELEESFSDYIRLGQSQYVPLAIQIDNGKMHFDWTFIFYEPSVWLFSEAEYYCKDESAKAPIAFVDNVTVNNREGRPSQSPVVSTAQVNPSNSPRRMLSEGREKMELVIAANHSWLLPSLDVRKGFAYRYRQEGPYLETILFDDQGNIFAQLDGCEKSPDAPTGQLFYQPGGAFIRTQFDNAFIRPPKIRDKNPIIDKLPVQKDRRLRNLATGLNFDCALTRLARNPEDYHVTSETLDNGTYRLVLTTSSRDAKIFTGTMLAFTSWAYMHDVRYQKSEIVCDAQTHRPMTEKDYDGGGKLVASYTFSDYLSDPDGDAPGEITAVIPHEKKGQDSSLEMEAVFEFAGPGLWLLKTCHSEFRGSEGGSTGSVEVTPAFHRSFQPVSQFLERLEKTQHLLMKINEASQGRVVADLGADDTLDVCTNATWSDKAGQHLDDFLKDAAENDRPTISIVQSRYTGNGEDGFKVVLDLFSNLYWREFETVLTVELLNSAGVKLSEATISARLRAEGSPSLTPVEVEFSDIENIDTIDKIAVTATVERETARHRGSCWFTYTNP